MVVGTYASDQPYFKAPDLIGDCADATHVASHVTVGAFRLFALSRGELQGDVAIAGAEAGGGSRSSEQNLNAGGEEVACAKATAGDEQPPDGCSTSLQIVLTQLTNGEPPAATAPRDKPAWTGQKTAALVAGGVGVLGTGIGLIIGASASSKWSQAKSDCGAGCAQDSVAEHEKSDAQGAATLASVVVGLGAAALVTGAILWFTAPDCVPARRAARIGVTPSANAGGAGARLYGEF